MPTQLQLFYAEQKKLGESNQLFLDLVNDGMTREQLQANINRRPELWGRWQNWLAKLPQTPISRAFTYPELTPEAQQRALEDWAHDQPYEGWWDMEEENLREDMKLRGIEIEDVQFSGFYSQGDGSSFVGNVDLLHFMNWDAQQGEASRHLATTHKEVYLSQIPFNGEASVNYEWMVNITRNSHHYSHENTVSTNIEYNFFGDGDDDLPEDAVISLENDLNDIMREYMRSYYKQLEAQYDYLTGEEAFIESCADNAWLFDESGELTN